MNHRGRKKRGCALCGLLLHFLGKKTMILLHTFIVLLLMFSISEADIYKYVDENGVVHYSNVPNKNAVMIVSSPVSNSNHDSQRYSNIEKIAERKSFQYRLDPSLVKAIIKAESDWNPSAISPKGAIGLMQLMPQTIKHMAVSNPFDPAQNIDGGIRYLKYLLKRFHGDLTLALAAYSAGPTAVERYGTIPPYRETRYYVNKILSSYHGKTFYPQRKRKRHSTSNNSQKIFRKVMPDGTVLYTNSPFYLKRMVQF